MPYYSFEKSIRTDQYYRAAIADAVTTADQSRVIRIISPNFVRPGDVVMKFDSSSSPPLVDQCVEMNRDSKLIKAVEFGYISYGETPNAPVAVFPVILVSPDKLRARVILPDCNAIKRPFSLNDLLSEIERRHFRLDFDKDAVRRGFDSAKKGDGAVIDFARGSAPIDTRPADIRLSIRPITRQFIGGDRFVLAFDFKKLPIVAAQSTIAVIMPPKPGIDGEDVYGKTLSPRGSQEPLLAPADGTVLSEDKRTVAAAAAGLLTVIDRAVSVLPIRETHTMNNADEPSLAETLIVRGNIERSRITSRCPIIVLGDVISSSLRSDVGVFVQGCVQGSAEDRIVSGGDITATSIIGVTVLANGHIVSGRIENARIKTNAAVITSNAGTISGGKVEAALGISAGVVSGSALACGNGDEIAAKLTNYAAKEEDNQAMIKKFLGKLGPNFLKGHREYLKALSPDQHETAKVLMREYNNICIEQRILKGRITKISDHLALVKHARIQCRRIAPPVSIAIASASRDIGEAKENVEYCREDGIVERPHSETPIIPPA
ncbi:MAG: FapA family protein [Spirochaetota bacterium]